MIGRCIFRNHCPSDKGRLYFHKPSTVIGQFPIRDGLFRPLHLAYFRAPQLNLTLVQFEVESVVP